MGSLSASFTTQDPVPSPGPIPLEVPLQVLPTLRLSGRWQMAIDAWMLEQRRPMLRLYRWSRPTLSLGHHQRQLESHWLDLARRGVIDLVRRPSGGRAVLHGGDLTYALVWPQAPGGREQVYRQACDWLQQAFAQLGEPLQFGRQAARGQPASCFALSTAADLVDHSGRKRIGSAQLWRQGCLLQHGSIPLEPPAELWQQIFGTPPPALPHLPLQGQALELALLASACRWLPPASAGVVAAGLGADALAAISAQVAASQGEVLASPEATMARTTGARARPRG
jgi:lipoate-protein ligase A